MESQIHGLPVKLYGRNGSLRLLAKLKARNNVHQLSGFATLSVRLIRNRRVLFYATRSSLPALTGLSPMPKFSRCATRARHHTRSPTITLDSWLLARVPISQRYLLYSLSILYSNHLSSFFLPNSYLICGLICTPQVLIKSLRELAESGGSNLATIEKYMRQSFSGAADVNNLTKLIRLAAHRAVTKVNIMRKYSQSPNFIIKTRVLIPSVFFFFFVPFRVFCNRMVSITQFRPGRIPISRNVNDVHRSHHLHQSLLEIRTNLMAIPAILWKRKKKICTIGPTAL